MESTKIAEYTRTLNSYAELDEVGGKARTLMRLAQANYNVAPGFAITTNAYTYWLRSKELPSRFQNELQQRLKWHSYELTYPLIVRSSATVEDQSKASFAGVFTSCPNVRSFDELVKSVVRIYEDSGSQRVRRYCEFQRVKEIKMGVLVQKQLDPEYSGILFTRNPVNNKDEMVVEFVKGVPWGLVSGHEEGKREVLHGKSRKFIHLYQMAKEIEEFLSGPQDIEWAFVEKEFWILQSRPITTPQAVTHEPKTRIRLSRKAVTLTGTPASLGYAHGKIQYIEDNVPVKEADQIFAEGNILATRGLWLEYDNIMSNAGAIVTYDNSINSHSAIIAREKKIPCVVGVDLGKLSRYAADFDEVIVDADNGKIIVPTPRVSHLRDITEIKTGQMPAWTSKVSKQGLRIINLLSRAVIDENVKEFEDEINKAIIYMMDNARAHPEVSRPLFHRLAAFFQEDFARLLRKRYPQKHILERFAYVDSTPTAEPQEVIDRLYMITKKYMNTIGELRVDGRRVWELELPREKN